MDTNALFPPDVMNVLNTGFMGLKVWHILIIALIVPSPIVIVLLFFMIPGFKDKVTDMIRNGVPRVYSGLSNLTGEVSEGSSKGGSSYSPKA
jgi:H+/gluconate symporter-like permease